MAILPRLKRWFGECNLAKKINSGEFSDMPHKLKDIQDGSIYRNFMKSHSIPPKHIGRRVKSQQKSKYYEINVASFSSFLSLPPLMQNILGTMMLAGIIPGSVSKEPQSLDPYTEVIVDELFYSINGPELVNSYSGAPIKMKAAVFYFHCEIPAYSKLLHYCGQAAIRTSLTAMDGKGIYCKRLRKAIHPCSRRFLPITSIAPRWGWFFHKKKEQHDPPTHITKSNGDCQQGGIRVMQQ